MISTSENSERVLTVILVDTTVLVDFFRRKNNAKVAILVDLMKMETPLGISGYSYMEILSGAKSEREFNLLRTSLGPYCFYHLAESEEKYRKVGRMYFDLRKKGITPRSKVDLLIAATAIEYGLYLLHDDRDFDIMAKHLPELKIYGGTSDITV